VCGRYVASRDPEGLAEEFEVDETAGDGPGEDPAAAQPNYNVAPTAAVPVVLERHEPAVRWLRLLTWGLVPSWSRDRGSGGRMINARAESLLDRPAYRRPALARRCLVPADGWYEWQRLGAGTAGAARRGRAKQPFHIHPVDGAPIAFAGIYEFWRDPELPKDDPGSWLTTFAILTVPAEQGLAAVHDRMPLVLPRDRWAAWLDPAQRDPDAVLALTGPPPPGRFVAVPVSSRVNSVANNDPELLRPIPTPGSAPASVDPVTGEILGGPDTPLF